MTKRRLQPTRYAFVHGIGANNSQKLEVTRSDMGTLWETENGGTGEPFLTRWSKRSTRTLDATAKPAGVI
jgi:hypothetical protein